jgi:hypothetical protein
VGLLPPAVWFVVVMVAMLAGALVGRRLSHSQISAR